jgi:hypothetical protein
MRRQRPYRDSTLARASLSDLGRVLKTIRDRREVGMMVFIFVWGISLQDASRRLGLSERDGERVLTRALAHLRHPSRSQSIRDEADGDPLRSMELRRWAQAAAQDMVVTCAHCGHAFVPEHIFLMSGGRPPRFCSNACRQRAYRARKRAALDDTV